MTSLSIFSDSTNPADLVQTMSTREIAELTSKLHKDVLYDTRKMLEELGLTSADFSADVPDSYGRLQPVFLLPKRESLILVSGYSTELRARIIDRWEALETGKALPAMAQPSTTAAIDKPDPQAFAVVQTAWVEAVHHKIASKREALQFLRDASAVMIHGVDVLQRAAKSSKPAKALPAPTQATLTNGESVPYGFRAAGTKSATDLLRYHGVSAQAKALYDAMEKQNMVTTRYDLTVDQPGCRVLIGEGLQYGQNVMLFESVRSNPYFYHDKFAALLKRVGLLVDATPKPTASERALRDYKNIVKDAWNTYGCKTLESANRDGIHTPYLTRSALIQYLTIELGKPEKTAQNFATPRSDAMRALFADGFLSKHKNGWLILDGDSI